MKKPDISRFCQWKRKTLPWKNLKIQKNFGVQPIFGRENFVNHTLQKKSVAQKKIEKDARVAKKVHVKKLRHSIFSQNSVVVQSYLKWIKTQTIHSQCGLKKMSINFFLALYASPIFAYSFGSILPQ